MFAIAVGLYLPALHGTAIWDDIPLISGNGSFGTQSLIAAFTKSFGNYYRPLTSASFALENMYAHGNTFFYHANNIVLHGITSVLVCYLVFLITQKWQAGILSGLFFAAQPMQVGAAAWIGGRTDVLSAFFLTVFLISLVSYHKTVKITWFGAALLSYFCAALAKEQAAVILPVVPLSVFVFGSRQWKQVWRLSAPFLVVLTVYLCLWSLGAPFLRNAHNSLSYTIMLAMRTAAHYGLAFIAPNKPSLITFTLENYTGFAWIPLGAVIIAGSVLYLRKAWSSQRELAWIAICGILVYLPISNCPTVPSLVVGPFRCGEAGVAVACLFGIGASMALTSKKFLLASVLGANLLVGAYVTWWGVHQWLSPEGFFKAVVANDPHFIVGAEFDAHYLDAAGKSEEASEVLDSVMSWLFATRNWPEVMDSKQKGAINEVVKQRLRSNSGIPNVLALANFIAGEAFSLAQSGRGAKAALVAKDALIISPDDTWINFLYGSIVLPTDRQEAIRHWEHALKINPHYSECALALGHQRMIDRDYSKAVPLLEEGLKEHANDGYAWLEMSDAKIAARDWRGALNALDRAKGSRVSPPQMEIDKRRRTIEVALSSAKPGPSSH